jgi:hypothetical protein
MGVTREARAAGPAKEAAIRMRFEQLGPSLNERARRLFAATEALAFGYGGIIAVYRATGIAPRTIGTGLKELRALEEAAPVVGPERVRQRGGGRKHSTEKDPTLLPDLERLVEPVTRGDPESPLRWTSKSLSHLLGALTALGHKTSERTVGRLLKKLGYSLQANAKTREGASHPDRDAQFQHINARVAQQLATRNPAISVDTKKKELVGDFKNGGRELRPRGRPERVRVHDFAIPELGRVSPYGVYDIGRNEGWVSVGIDHDTATFAVESIRRWWHTMGAAAYAKPTSLLITADGGGSNGSRLRLWKVELQRLADELRLPISVCHYPPGTSKWNKIEHRLFSFITQNWRGKPLVTHQVIVSLIAATTTSTGLTVRCDLDANEYPTAQKVSDGELAAVNLHPDDFHGEWNYTIRPHRRRH